MTPYAIYAFLMAVGTYVMLTHRNLLKVVIGLSLLQSGAILFFILLSYRSGATVPIAPAAAAPMHNPLPHALMLTAIVVGVATLGVALAILRRHRQEEGGIEEES